MLNYKILQYKHKTLKDGTHPIILQIVSNEKPKRYSIVKSCFQDQWNVEKGGYNSKMPNYKVLNMLLTNVRSKVELILSDMAKIDKPFTFEAFDKYYKGINKPIGLYTFIETIIEELEKKGKIGNKNVYVDTLNALKGFKPSTNLQPEDIDYNFLVKFESFLVERGGSNGGISVRMRTLRAILNEAINRSYLHKDFYPFSTPQSKIGKYPISKLKSNFNPRGLSNDEIVSIKNFDSDLNSHLKLAHYYFLFSYFGGGMNFTDMAHLKWSHIMHNRINFSRKKTGHNFSVLISEPIQFILDHFNKNKEDKESYIFPILNNLIHISPQQKNDRIKKCLKQYNIDLKMIQVKLGIQSNLTSYVARHSFAQVLKSNGISNEIISQKLGHKDLKTTDYYLSKLSVDETDFADKVL
ncbi:MAG: site-specific integrase [Saprospiraceae bacterium]|nr:site-specific integrase [Candidatus Defluviibacterium haderslevense]